MATKAELEQQNGELEQQNTELKSTLDQMQAQMQTLMEQFSAIQNTTATVSNVNPIESIISANKKIKVINLIEGELNLTTQMYGAGKPFRFPHYGYEHNIKYNDLEDIVHSHRSFAEKGFFYICDADVVDELGLEDHYKNILTQTMIEDIVNNPNESNLGLFAGANETVQDSIVDRMVDKINIHKKKYDLNIISKMNEIYGKDIVRIADQLKNIKK